MKETMKYLPDVDMADIWTMPVKVIREYCEKGCIPGAVRIGIIWQIPTDTPRPEWRPNKNS